MFTRPSDQAATLVAVRGDSLGDVLLCEPALRSLAALGSVTLVCSPRGRAAAELIDSVTEVIVDPQPWMVMDPAPVDAVAFGATVDRIAAGRHSLGVIFTSGRQDALPSALLLRLAGVPVVGAYSNNYPGSLLDVRLRHGSPVHEVERNLELVAAMGVPLVADRRMHIRRWALPVDVDAALPEHYVVVHPGAAAPSRTPSPERWIDAVRALLSRGREVVVTGEFDEPSVTVAAACTGVIDLVGATSLGALAEVLARADAVCVGNTGVMHLAAAAGASVVACFPPTVRAEGWLPWMVPHLRLDGGDVACAPCHLVRCPLPSHPCAGVAGERVADAVDELMAATATLAGG